MTSRSAFRIALAAETHARRARCAEWMARLGLSHPRAPTPTVSEGMRFWKRAGIKVSEEWGRPESLGDGHIDVFSRGREEVVYLAQPYVMDDSEAEVDLASRARKEAPWRKIALDHGLTFTASMEESWHFPGRTILLALWREGHAPRLGPGGRFLPPASVAPRRPERLLAR